ncbi:MAG: universal stress protein [Proteobacteria bacterium]|nr:universal stress protein [Pseudomonadota bacterium]
MSSKHKTTSKAVMAQQDLHRVLVALDASSYDDITLEVAASLAYRLQAELEGLFVESADLFRLTELDAVHEIGFSSASRRLLDKDTLSRSMKMLAAHAQTQLALLAQQYQLTCSFHITRGQILTKALALSQGCDVMVVGTSGTLLGPGRQAVPSISTMVHQSQCSLLLLQQRAVLGASVMVLYDGSAQANVAAKLGAQLVRKQAGTLHIILLADRTRSAEIADQAKTAVGDAVSISFHQFDGSQISSLSALLRKEGCGLLLVPATGLADVNAVIGLEQLIRLACPVLLVR